MKANRETLEDQLEAYEQKLAGLKSFIRELTDRAAELGTDRELIAEDLFEAQHNVEHYKEEIARIRQELGESSGGAPPPRTGGGGVPRPRAGAGGVLPQTAKQGLGSVIISAVSFLAGAFLGSKVKSRKGGAGENK